MVAEKVPLFIFIYFERVKRGAQTHDSGIKSPMLYRPSYPGTWVKARNPNHWTMWEIELFKNKDKIQANQCFQIKSSKGGSETLALESYLTPPVISTPAQLVPK